MNADSNSRKRLGRLAFLAVAILLVSWLVWQTLLVDRTVVNKTPYIETFDAVGSWTIGNDVSASAAVTNGVYAIEVNSPQEIYLGTQQQLFGDGIYELTTNQTDGPIDNGYGMIFRYDVETRTFYLFEISADGYVWIGVCEERCENQGWEASDAINTGRNAQNHLRVVASQDSFTFYINDVEIKQMTDATIASGTIGVMVETLGQPGVRVEFDDFSVTPLE